MVHWNEITFKIETPKWNTKIIKEKKEIPEWNSKRGNYYTYYLIGPEIPSKICEIRRIIVFPEDNLQMLDFHKSSQSSEDYLQEKQLSSEFHRFSKEFQVLLPGASDTRL